MFSDGVTSTGVQVISTGHRNQVQTKLQLLIKHSCHFNPDVDLRLYEDLAESFYVFSTYFSFVPKIVIVTKYDLLTCVGVVFQGVHVEG